MKKCMFGLLVSAVVLVLAPLVAQARTANPPDREALEAAKTEAGSNEVQDCTKGDCASHNNRTPLTEDRKLAITQVGDVLKDTGSPGDVKKGKGSAVRENNKDE